jgi:hypothetical protein
MKNIKAIKNRKGAMFYTLAGIMVIALVAIVALHILRTTYTPKTADSLHVQKLGDAIYSLQSEIGVLAREAQYPAVWKAGHNVSADGVNYYLTLSNGREKLREDLTKDLSAELDRLLSERALLLTEDYYVIESSGINITVSRIDPSDVSVKESTEGLTATIPLHMRAKYRDIRYEDHFNLTSETPVRIFDMYDRAKAFHENYANNVQWATTIALYTRAYINGYDPTYTGSFLKEGHLAYDPLEQFLSGDIEAVKNFKLESIDDIGSIPVATWLTEWQYLSEPSFLPPSYDFSTGKEGNAKIVDLLKKNYDVDKSADCGSITDSQQKQDCIDYNDPVKIREKADAIADEREKLVELADEIESWSPSMNDECDDFKSEAEDLITAVETAFDENLPNDEIINPSLHYSTGTELENEIDSNKKQVSELKDAIDELTNIQINRLGLVKNSECKLPLDMDCKRVRGPDDCEEADDCLKCDDPDPNVIDCFGKDGPDFSCSSESENYARRETVSCEYTYCEEYDEEGSCTKFATEDKTRRVDIEQCNCMCHPKGDIISDLQGQLNLVKQKIKDRENDLLNQENMLRARAQSLEEAMTKYKEIEDLSQSTSSSNYDVVSKLNYSNVKYYPITSSAVCYLDPTYLERENGTCGDKTASVGIYTAQVSAATICCALSGTCCPAIKYASEWFPAIYQVEGKYSISESIVDDKNRIMLHNVFAEDGDLYGMNVTPKLFIHVAPEFVIYRNHTIDVKSQTGGRVIVYLYLPKIAQTTTAQGGAVNKVIQSFEDPTCNGKTC